MQRLGGVTPQERLELAPGALVPGPRVDADGLDPDVVGEWPVAARGDLRHTVEDRAVEGWQDLGGRVRVHRATGWRCRLVANGIAHPYVRR